MTTVVLKPLDAQILRVLLQDGRATFADIADACAVSRNKVWKRHAALVQKGVITGATVQMNFAKFGYDALATVLINVEANQLSQIMSYIEKITEVRAYRAYNSVYNIRAVATLKDLSELDHVKQAVKRKIPTVGLRTYIWTDVRNIPENLAPIRQAAKSLAAPNRHLLPPPTDFPEGKKIGDLDMRIVQKLTVDGRASFAEVARAVGTSTDTAMKRIQKLTESAAIKVCVQIDPSKIGYSSILDFNVSFASAQDLSGTVVDLLADIPNLIAITKTSGDYDMQLTAMVKDVAEYLDIQDQIAKVRGVTKMEANMRRIPSQWPTPLQHISTM